MQQIHAVCLIITHTSLSLVLVALLVDDFGAGVSWNETTQNHPCIKMVDILKLHILQWQKSIRCISEWLVEWRVLLLIATVRFITAPTYCSYINNNRSFEEGLLFVTPSATKRRCLKAIYILRFKALQRKKFNSFDQRACGSPEDGSSTTYSNSMERTHPKCLISFFY